MCFTVILSYPAHSQNGQRVGLAREGRAVSETITFTDAQLQRPGMVCIRHNNYWCMKSVGWQGEIGSDSRGHANFSDPAYSARAAARQLHTWRRRDKLRTAFEIMSKYAPPDDCVGSIGRPPNCPHGINPTREYAIKVAEAVGKGPDDDLGLFDQNLKMNKSIAIPILRAISAFELPDPYIATDDLIRRGIDLAGH
jgi:hypothetical protein